MSSFTICILLTEYQYPIQVLTISYITAIQQDRYHIFPVIIHIMFILSSYHIIVIFIINIIITIYIYIMF